MRRARVPRVLKAPRPKAKAVAPKAQDKCLSSATTSGVFEEIK